MSDPEFMGLGKEFTAPGSKGSSERSRSWLDTSTPSKGAVNRKGGLIYCCISFFFLEK